MKSFKILMMATLTVLFFAQNTIAQKTKEQETEKTTYACSMHPQVTSNKPGKCSKCNMDLKEKNDDHSNQQQYLK